uniref:Uncharacterized protein n=1 Tax=Setaria italica TaxID=4555 RepID=K3YP15_SETIT
MMRVSFKFIEKIMQFCQSISFRHRAHAKLLRFSFRSSSV